MAKKFKIAQDPTFKQKVSVPRIGGESIDVLFEYKYLSRKDLAAMYESWQEEAKNLDVSDESSLSELTEAEVTLQVRQLKDILIGWDFDDEFSDENIRALVETSVHASHAILDQYQTAYAKAKLGN